MSSEGEGQKGGSIKAVNGGGRKSRMEEKESGRE